MECKFCGAELDEFLQVCPYCGGNLEEDLVTENEAEIVSVTDCVLDETAELEESVPVKRRKLWQIIVALGCCVALLAMLLLTVLNSLGISFGFRENNISYKDSFLVTDEMGGRTRDKVIAKIGDMELTNGELQVYYTLQIYDYVQYYGSVLSYIGLDATKPLGEQPCYFDDTLTWQQYFINISIETWKRYAVLNMLAKEAGIALPEGEVAALEKMPQEMEAMAKEYDFENADVFIKSNYGANVDMDAYMSYMRACYLGEYFYSLKSMELMPLSADIETYYDAHKSDFETSGITKDSGPIVDVRHILVQPEGGEKDASGNTVYTEDAWAKALKDAEDILNKWKSGDATQDSFAALATEFTDDTASAPDGGLYQNITRESNYVKPFLEWAVDENRKAGDTDIVKTDFGYHIMYFVSGEHQWIMAARTQLLSERVNEIIESGSERWPVSINYKAIAICANEIVK